MRVSSASVMVALVIVLTMFALVLGRISEHSVGF